MGEWVIPQMRDENTGTPAVRWRLDSTESK
jgi:hypothetical protein